ncbi:dinucleotide-binding enzyme [Burkholderia cenocepacia]|uniref:NADPH-dependent F420 reductase n=1 Tax=Burkholderia cenocepacia TaxID=95486 RepID=UPI000F5854BB|nr:NAD(P)-binding domain-containing protein [Burkholderia cenocepacia]RQU32835.1 dinucleotide-binding enzyme [Burkholderia cenocepacia]RQU57022.1 dinucleotide-binding enzyme [Burkholderia cenocepacia]
MPLSASPLQGLRRVLVFRVLPSILAISAIFPLSTAAEGKPTIGIIGAGQEGGTLGTLWAKAGYKVVFASRDPTQLQALVARIGPNVSVGTVSQVIDKGDVVVLAVPYHAEPEIARQYGSQLAGKILIDVDNAYPGRDGNIAITAREVGIARYSARLFAGTRFVRALNSVNASSLGPGCGQALYSYTDDQAGQLAAELIRAVGCTPVRGQDL